MLSQERHRPTIDELEKILSQNPQAPVHLNPDGSITTEDREIGCTIAGPKRGDCEHFIGLPGKSIPGQHDGPDDTVDCYGRPNGWCWSCWKSYRLQKCREALRAAINTVECASINPETKEELPWYKMAQAALKL